MLESTDACSSVLLNHVEQGIVELKSKHEMHASLPYPYSGGIEHMEHLVDLKDAQNYDHMLELDGYH
jgi:hypothetical protein